MLGLLLLTAVCLGPGTWMAAGADTPVTVQVQQDLAPMERDPHKEVVKVESYAAKVVAELNAIVATLTPATVENRSPME